MSISPISFSINKKFPFMPDIKELVLDDRDMCKSISVLERTQLPEFREIFANLAKLYLHNDYIEETASLKTRCTCVKQMNKTLKELAIKIRTAQEYDTSLRLKLQFHLLTDYIPMVKGQASEKAQIYASLAAAINDEITPFFFHELREDAQHNMIIWESARPRLTSDPIKIMQAIAAKPSMRRRTELAGAFSSMAQQAILHSSVLLTRALSEGESFPSQNNTHATTVRSNTHTPEMTIHAAASSRRSATNSPRAEKAIKIAPSQPIFHITSGCTRNSSDGQLPSQSRLAEHVAHESWSALKFEKVNREEYAIPSPQSGLAKALIKTPMPTPVHTPLQSPTHTPKANADAATQRSFTIFE